jgi:cobalamin synthase
MNNELKQTEELFKKLKNLFDFLSGIQLFLTVAVCIVVLGNFLSPAENLQNEFLWIVIFSNAFAIILARFIYSYFTKNKIKTTKLQEKIEQFKYLAVLRLGILFIDNLINITVFLFSQNLIILLIVLIVFALSIVYRPTLKNFNKNYSESLTFN